MPPAVIYVNEADEKGVTMFEEHDVKTEGVDVRALTNDQINDTDVVLNLKTAADGHTILIPQPSSSPLDPLNWSTSKKNRLLFLISAVAFLPDFGSSLGIVTLLPQATEWSHPPNIIQHNLVGNIICLGAGGLVAAALSDYFGRFPVLFWFQLISLGTGIWCALAQSFPSYLAARILNGFFSIAALTSGLMWIKDLFFFHERPRKINLWSGVFIISPYLGPCLSAFIISKTSWRWCFWLYTILNFTGLVLIVVFGEETYYNRSLSPERQPVRRSRILRMIGWEKQTTCAFTHAVALPVLAISKVAVLAMTTYAFINFAWLIGVNATISIWLTDYYDFKPEGLGFFYFGPMLGSIIGELIGHWMHDLVATVYANRHRGRIDPEARLIMVYPASALMAISVLVLGFALQYRWHYMVIVVFAGMQVAGVMIATTAVNAYLLDCYPEASGELSAWVNVGRTFGGFMATYIEILWVNEMGPAAVFGIQAGVTVAGGLIPLFLQLYGGKIRQRQGQLKVLD